MIHGIFINIFFFVNLWTTSLGANRLMIDLIFGVLMPLSTIFQLYHGDQF
jgi:hypothetical protein